MYNIYYLLQELQYFSHTTEKGSNLYRNRKKVGAFFFFFFSFSSLVRFFRRENLMHLHSNLLLVDVTAIQKNVTNPTIKKYFRP